MEIARISDNLYSFKSCKCSECDFRFGCYTSESSCCPLKAVRIVQEEMGDNHLFMKCFGCRIEINENLGKFDSSLLAQIGGKLADLWSEQNAESKRQH